MPRGDRTGPAGAGSMTGRRAGYCSGFVTPGFANPAMLRQALGFGFRYGGRGWRSIAYTAGLLGWQRFNYTPSFSQDEDESLKIEVAWLKYQLAAIDKRLEILYEK